MGAADEIAYSEKLKDLVKYVEPLMNLINKMPKGEEHTAKRNKLVNIYDVFTNKRKVKMNFLTKCEQVVQTLLSVSAPGPSAILDTSYASKPSTLQAVTENLVPLSSNLTFVATARQCIGLVNDNLSSATFGHPKPPRKRRRHDSDDANSSCLPDSLQLEIATLCSRYTFQIVSTAPTEKHVVTLCCKPKNRDFPRVPSILVRVAEDYPKNIPEYTMSVPGESDLVDCIKGNFVKILQSKKKQSQFVTCILEAWEQSINDALTA